MKCDNCNRPATVHLTEIRNGKKIEKHLCEQCAAQSEGLPLSKSHTPINELLTNFVLAHSGVQKETAANCEGCGITWAEFRQTGLFGCQHDYDVFEKDLSPLLQRAHEGSTHHTGKVPARAGGTTGAAAPAGAGAKPAPKAPQRKVMDVTRLRKELQRAIELEDYERAAKLRDQIREAEGA